MENIQEYTVHGQILAQLGGRRFLAMTGSKHLTYSAKDNNWLSMHLTRNKSGAQYLKIILTPADTYTMIFSKSVKKYETMPLSGKKFCVSETLVVVETKEGIYDDILAETFTEVTGLYTHL